MTHIFNIYIEPLKHELFSTDKLMNCLHILGYVTSFRATFFYSLRKFIVNAEPLR